ncbi:hypothetical protein [Streptantibioticus silvisoli]|uniref:Uncharacterized protein n=1 Tax=Streptantibioticus silvisoli TaxID=2705255 RepID=A0ABT6W7R6_9ACTN|nr:hypothetical protein [Streptantibioticus silvisoli]MDI5966787.1 hypothetical protein [Streptantibioticus silvisoli]
MGPAGVTSAGVTSAGVTSAGVTSAGVARAGKHGGYRRGPAPVTVPGGR